MQRVETSIRRRCTVPGGPTCECGIKTTSPKEVAVTETEGLNGAAGGSNPYFRLRHWHDKCTVRSLVPANGTAHRCRTVQRSPCQLLCSKFAQFRLLIAC